MANCNMTGKKTFTSSDGNFSLKLPLDWEEYDDGEQNTVAFFNAKSWTGNFRITPFYWTMPTDSSQLKAAEFIQDELTENEGAVRLKFGSFDCAHYKKDTEQDGDKLVMYYWAIGKTNNLFMCSLTIDKAQEQKVMNKEVLETVQDIIKSIKIN
jgi:Domain of unknown function (DUF3805)